MEKMEQSDELLNEAQAAKVLGSISVKTLQSWRVRGYGPCWVAIGRSIRYRRLDLQTFIASQVRRSTSDVGRELVAGEK